MPAGVYLGTEQGIALANSIGLEMLGVASTDELQNDITKVAEKIALRWAETGERVSPSEQVFSRALRGERAEQTVLHRNLRTGEDLVVRSAAAPIVEDGRVVGAVVINTDMTAQKEIEASLRQFQFLSDNANDALFLLDSEGSILYVNAAACRSLGYSAEELQQMRASDIDPIHDAATYQALFQRADGERLPPFESLHRRAGGTTFPIEASVSRVDIGGRPLLFSSCRDISARKAAEEALRVANQRTATILESITDAFFALDTGWRFTYLNDQAERLLQRSREELLGRNVWGEFPAAVGSTFESNYRRAFEEQTVITFEEYYPPPLDTWFEVRAYPSPESLSIFFQDVSARKRLDAERERLLAEQKARAEREALLNRIGQALRESPDPEAVQGAAVQLLGEALGADRCYFALYDLAAGNVRITHERNRPELPSIQGTYPFTNTAEMFRELYRGSNTSVIPDRLTAALSTQTLANMEALQIRSRVSVALADTGGLMATLTASMSEGPRDWTTEDAALVEAVATQLRSGVETIRARQREHRIATDLQDALQPPVPEQIPGLSVVSYTQPALQEASVGGDFYDVFPLDKELYAIVMGDVSGKGLAAAQQLALIRNSLRTTLYLYRAPAQAVSNLNAIVTAHDLLAGFVTAWVGVYEVSTGQITYASCGHEPALVRRAATGSVEELGTTGLPLGVSENAEYGENTITLTKDDMLLLYTDGISESGPSRSELLGTEGLARFFARETGSGDVRADAAHLVAAVSERSLGVFRDDVAVLLSRRL